MKPADVTQLHALSQPSVTPDGEFAVVAVTRPDLDSDEYRGHLWIVPPDGSAAPRPFTTGWRDTAPAYSPDGAWLAFLRATGGEGKGSKSQLYVMPPGGGEPRRVTDQPLGAGAPVWSPDSRLIAFVARVPDEGRYTSGRAEAEPPRRITTLQYREDNVGFYIDRRAHVFVVDPFGAPGSQPVQVTSGDFDHEGVAWSPDGEDLAFASARHDSRDTDLVTDIWRCAPDGSRLRPVTRGGSGDGQKLSASKVLFTPDGRSVCFAAAELGPSGRGMTGRHVGVWSVPADGSEPPRRLTDAETIHLSREGTIETGPDGVLACAERPGAGGLLVVPYDAGEPKSLLAGGRQVEVVVRAESVLVAVVADPGSRGELIAVADGTERKLSSFAGVPALPMEEFTATAPDGYPVHGWIVRPEGTGPHPVLLMIHGGPFTQYGWRLSHEAHVYPGAGYQGVTGQPMGSSGYGQTHGTAIIGDAAADAAVDLLAPLGAAPAPG